ncbi:MAG TPA: hypothetical protein VGS19_01805 [Streptosporangiaceae bacterium]|nr:hypothetical protein [Streptosporangiaceae bacterium]
MSDVSYACPVLSAGTVAAYLAGELGTVAAWSVEAHVPGCAVCQRSMAGTDPERVARNRRVLLTRLALPELGLIGRALRRIGVPEHVIRLLSATPSLRRSWLAGMALVLATAVGLAHLLAPGPAALVSLPASDTLVPFLVLAPLLPLAAVATAFSARLDPAAALATAAPVPKIRLLCVRGTAVIAAALVPTVLAAFALPGPWWLPEALLLPALAVCVSALAAGTVAGMLPGAVAAGAAWVAAAVGTGLADGSPVKAFGPVGQVAALAVLLGAAAFIVARRDRLDFGLMG